MYSRNLSANRGIAIAKFHWKQDAVWECAGNGHAVTFALQ
jgi:hypothetical protein